MVITIMFLFTTWNVSKIQSIFHEDDVENFQLESGVKIPLHLDLINPLTDVKSIGFENLDTTHKKGRIHKGAALFLFDSTLPDSNARILLLKRGKDMLTCPSTWSVIGEHTFRDENPIETAKRGVLEELGSAFFDHMNDRGQIRNLTEYPVYYERDYGPSNGNRIDRQITYLWLVEMNLSSNDQTSRQEADALLQLDHEVADHSWKPLDQFEQWLMNDDAVAPKDFCHPTIVSLLRLGIERVKLLSSKL